MVSVKALNHLSNFSPTPVEQSQYKDICSKEELEWLLKCHCTHHPKQQGVIIPLSSW